MSTTPAFSPGPCTTSLPRVGRRFRCTLLDLYEQCSLHITLKIPSSVMLGSRPRICWMRAYSSRVTPCSEAISGVTLTSTLAVAICTIVALSRFSFRDSVQIRRANHSPEYRVLQRPLPPFAFPDRSRLRETRETRPRLQDRKPSRPPPSQCPPHPRQRAHSRDRRCVHTLKLHSASRRKDKTTRFPRNLQTRRKRLPGPVRKA